ncbi:MAG: hypothetical protein PHP74_04410 [Candidatus Gracilibacteria bacterium]|nr:hypothetical protein [Candidatus Gracilibacteria bacterium]
MQNINYVPSTPESTKQVLCQKAVSSAVNASPYYREVDVRSFNTKPGQAGEIVVFRSGTRNKIAETLILDFDTPESVAERILTQLNSRFESDEGEAEK